MFPTKNAHTATKATGRYKIFKTCLFTQRVNFTFVLIKKKGKKGTAKTLRGAGAETKQL